MMMSGCETNKQSLKMPIPESNLLVEPCRLNLEPVTNSDEDLLRDAGNWECAGTWLFQVRGWQEWYKTTSSND